MIRKYLHIVIVILLVVCGQNVFSQETVDYTVQPGDNASKIAKKYGMDTKEFQRLNGFTDSTINCIQAGRVVKVINHNSQPEEETKIDSPTGDAITPNKSIEASNQRNDCQDRDGNHLRKSHQKVSSRRYSTNRDADKGAEKPVNKPILIFSLLLLISSVVWKTKYWNRLNIRNKENVFRVVVVVGILMALLSWRVTRMLLCWIIGILAVIAIAYFLTQKFANVNKKQAQNNFSTNDKGGTNQHKKDLEQENRRLKEENEQLRQEVNKLKGEYGNLLNENRDLGEQIEEFRSRLVKNLSSRFSNESKVGNNEQSHVANSSKGGKLYAESILDGVLAKVRDKIFDDAIFELDLQGIDDAGLTILPSAHQRILANSAFIEGCNSQIIGSTTIDVTPGKVVRNEQGKWVVTKKPVVIIR